MKKKILAILFIITFFLNFGLLHNNVNALGVTWVYEENLNDVYRNAGVFSTFQIYNKVTPQETTEIDMVGIYIFENTSNDTYTEELKFGVYSNYNNSPNVLLSQSCNIPVVSVGWLDCSLTPKITITKDIDFWIGGMIKGEGATGEGLVYYKIETNSDYITFGQLDKVWDTLFNPAEITVNDTDKRFACLRVGLSIDNEEQQPNAFLEFLKDPTTYLSGIIVIGFITMVIFLIIRKR